jgi:trigger factor
MSYTAKKISSNQMKFDFTVPHEEFEAAVQKAYFKDKGRISVPGFRKGKAPRKLIENMYGKSIFYETAFDLLFPDVYRDAVEKEEAKTVDRPEIDITQIGEGEDLKFTVTVYVRPDVTLGNYKGLEVTRVVPPVTDEQLDARIRQDVRRATTLQDVSDRPVEEGDITVIDYHGKLNGVSFDGGQANEQRLKIGSNTFIPGFEEQVVGMNIGEEKVITVTFPEKYQAEHLAGKEVTFDIKLHGIQEELIPELDDDFAKDVSSFDTFDEYKQDLKRQLEESRDKQADTQVEEQLIQQVVDASDCDIPSAMIEDEVDNKLRVMQMRIAYQGMRFEDYLQYTGMQESDVRSMLQGEAQNAVKGDLVLQAIAKEEKIEVSDEDVQGEIAAYAESVGRTPEEYEKTLDDHQKTHFKELSLVHKVIDLVKQNAKITETDKAPEAIDVEKVAEETAKAVEEAEKAEKPKRTRKTTKKTKDEDQESADKIDREAEKAEKTEKAEKPKRTRKTTKKTKDEDQETADKA